MPFIGETSLIFLFEKGAFRKASNHLYHGCRQKQNRKPAVDYINPMQNKFLTISIYHESLPNLYSSKGWWWFVSKFWGDFLTISQRNVLTKLWDDSSGFSNISCVHVLFFQGWGRGWRIKCENLKPCDLWQVDPICYGTRTFGSRILWQSHLCL